MVALAGCAQGSSVPQAAPPQQAEGLERAKSLDCTPGKEYYLSKDPPKRGGIFQKTGASANLDPTVGSGVVVGQMGQVYDTLLEQRSCFFEDIDVIPSLVKSWSVSADGKVWNMKLRDDVKWHNKPPVNGRKFTSADVAWTIDYQKKGAVLKTYWQDVNYTTPDANSIIMTLAQPRADFVYQLSLTQNVIVPREVYEQYGDFKTVAIGTGAFMMKHNIPNQISVQERNPDYYDMGRDGKPLPYVDGIENHGLADRTATEAAFLAGQLDVGGPETKDDADRWQKTMPKAQRGGGVRGTLHALFFNMSVKPWDDVKLRKAIAPGIVRDDILLGSRKGSFAESGFIPGAFPNFMWSVDKLHEKFKADPELSKKLLAEAGYGPGTVKVVMKTTGQYAQDAEVVQNHLQKIGINSTISVETPQAGGGGASIILNRGDYDIMWGVPIPSTFPDYWAYDIIRGGTATNIPRINDPKINELADAQRVELDVSKRKVLIDQIQERMYELMPFVPVMSTVTYSFYNCRVRNAAPDMPNSSVRYAVGLWLDSTGC